MNEHLNAPYTSEGASSAVNFFPFSCSTTRGDTVYISKSRVRLICTISLEERIYRRDVTVPSINHLQILKIPPSLQREKLHIHKTSDSTEQISTMGQVLVKIQMIFIPAGDTFPSLCSILLKIISVIKFYDINLKKHCALLGMHSHYYFFYSSEVKTYFLLNIVINLADTIAAVSCI